MKRGFTFICILWLLSFCAHAQTAGSLDTTFDPGTGSSDVFWQLAVQPDGKVVAVGRENISAPIYGAVYRLNTNGALDSSFSYGPRASNINSDLPTINAVCLQTNGNVLLGGQFSYIDSSIHVGLAQLNSVGTLDNTFTPSANPAFVYAMSLQPDGKIVIGGKFTNFLGSGQNYVARMNANGSLDNTFNVGAGPGNTVWSLTVAPDGKILIGGDFTNVNSYARTRLARLNSDGSVDTTFDPGAGADNTVEAIAVQNDNKIVIGGYFLNAGGTNRSRIARLNSNGTIDASFDPGNGPDLQVWALAIQSNGKILAGGRFNTVAGNPHKKIARFNTDGSVDSTFDSNAGSGSGTSDEVRSIKIQADGKILVAGKFTTFSGQVRFGLARLYGDPVPPTLAIGNDDSNVYVGISLSPGRTNILEFSTDLTSWAPLTNYIPPFTSPTVYPETNRFAPRRFYRVRSP